MSEDDLSKKKPVESERIQRMKRQEALLKKMTEPSAAMKKLIESESRMASITASTAGLEAAAKAISANLPVFEKVEMPGAIEAAKTMAAISPNIIHPPAFDALREISARVDAILAPAKETQAMAKALETFRAMDIPTFTKPELMNFLETSKYLDAIPHAALEWSNWISPLSIISQEISDCVAAISFAPLSTVLQETIYPYFNQKKQSRQERIFGQALSAAMWFPYMRGELFFTGFYEINQILSECENEHDRIQRIDQMVFSFYTDERVQEIKEEWRDTGLPEHIYRIMSQSVDAYLRGEYAMTTIVLSSLWEGIVGQKATGEDTYKVSRKTKENFKSLVIANNLPTVCVEFYESNIMYNCSSVEEVKPDVPGRHANAHGWFSAYPSRKAALNAIVFTDFLLNVTESIGDIEL